MNIKRILEKLLLLILIFCTSPLFAVGALAKISDSERSACGFLVSDGGKKYLYTSQTALFGMHLTGIGYKINVRSFSGAPVNVIGTLMVSKYSDVARVEVSTEATELLSIGEIKNFGGKLTTFPGAIVSESDKSVASTILGIGIDAFTLNGKFAPPFAGAPVLNAGGKVIGVLSDSVVYVRVLHLEKKKRSFICETVNINIAGRLDANIKWVPAEKVDFIEAGNVIKDTKTLLKAYMPILNWWLKAPYTSVPDNVSYPQQIKRFVLYNNERTPIIRKLVGEIQGDTIGHIGKMNKVREGCLHRADLFSAFSVAQRRQLMVSWKTPFLRNEGVRYSREWDKIIKSLQARRRGLEFQIPF